MVPLACRTSGDASGRCQDGATSRKRRGRSGAVLSSGSDPEDAMDPFARHRLGRSGLELPALGLGGAPFGDLSAEIGEANALATIEHACALGIGYFDTA